MALISFILWACKPLNTGRQRFLPGKSVSRLKRSLPQVLYLLCGVIAGLIISSVFFTLTGFSVFGRIYDQAPRASVTDNAELTTLAFGVLDDLRTGDYAALANAAHPDYGVVFSPRATVTLSANRTFMPEQIAAFGDDAKVYVWGVRDGSGEPIEMTPAEYIAGFINCKDYSSASVLGVNHIVRSGNALENITEVFPGVQFVDFYMSGDKDSAENLGWSSLRIGFEEYEGQLRLTVIIHSEWTE